MNVVVARASPSESGSRFHIILQDGLAMQSELSKNYFELFDIPVSFSIDAVDLKKRYRELQKLAHPDKYTNASDAERRMSVQLAAQVNEAYQVLSNPVTRARYMLELGGREINDQHTTSDEMFLMEQMELRETLEELRHSNDPQTSLMGFLQDVETRMRRVCGDIEQTFSQSSPDLDTADSLYRKLQFIDKLRREAEQLEDELSMDVDD
jgi:molecular chaperone HscB